MPNRRDLMTQVPVLSCTCWDILDKLLACKDSGSESVKLD